MEQAHWSHYMGCLDGFYKKARWVLDGHKQADPEVCAADIRNVYLQAPSSNKDHIICGPEFGVEHEGKVALIHRALYGGKNAGRDFRNHLRSCVHFLCPADPDVWMRPANKSDGTKVATSSLYTPMTLW
jgi:hypothetical protein